MYEDEKREFNWKSFLLKLAFFIVVVILIVKLLPIDNKKVSTEKSTEFKNNIIILREASKNYFNEDKLPTNENENVKLSLNDLIQVGAVESLKDKDGKDCDYKKSFVKATKKKNNYEVEVYLICGVEKDTSYININVEEKITTTEAVITTTKKKSTSTTTKKATEYITSKVKRTTSAPTKVSVMFNTNGGGIISDQYIKIGSSAQRPVNPTRDGYIFLGWFDQEKEFNFNSPVYSNTILKAKWLPVVTSKNTN